MWIVLTIIALGIVWSDTLLDEEEFLREPKSFFFPFDNRSLSVIDENNDSDNVNIARQGRQQGLACYSCGSLFRREAKECETFDPNNSSQRENCGPGEACMLYTWKKSRTEIGSYRECFDTSVQLGHPDFPVKPTAVCNPGRTQADSRSSIRACLCTTDFCNVELGGTSNEVTDIRASKEINNRRAQDFQPLFDDNDQGSPKTVICGDLVVTGADFADCNGDYTISTQKVSWDNTRPVFVHVTKDRYIFWNTGGLGWSIGKKAYLESGSHWHRSGLDTQEPWQGTWENGVKVECAGKSAVDCIWSLYSGWTKCSSSCGVGVQRKTRKVLQPAQNGGQECKGDDSDTRACQSAPCPTNCQWGRYGPWSGCSQTCGGGTRTRSREKSKQEGRGGRSCLGESEEVQFCQTSPCPELDNSVDVQSSRGLTGCCQKIQVRSTGGARVDQALYMGTYNRLARDFNDRAVYNRDGREPLYIYFFTSRQDQLSLWVIGPQLGQFIAGVRNSKTGTCVHDLGSGWKYASRAGVWEDNDPSLSVDCLGDRGQSESKKTTISPSNIINQVFDNTSISSGKQDCAWTPYGPWSECSKSCNRGNQIRVRRVLQSAKGGGRACRGGNRERRFCNRTRCPSKSLLQSATTRRTTRTTTRRTTRSTRRTTQTTRRTTTTTKRTTTTTRRTTTTTQIPTTTTIITTTSTRRPTTTTRRPTTTTRRPTTTTQRPTTTTRRPRTTTRRPRTTTRRIRTTTRRTTVTTRRSVGTGRNAVPGRVQCWACGSLFSTDAPDCPNFNKKDPSQLKTCDVGEACLFYSWKKSNSQTSVIRECFPTSILLGSIDDPVEPSPQCNPVAVESDNIRACICTTDFCSGIEEDTTSKSTSLVTTRRPVTEAPTAPPRRRPKRVQCHQCGSLFSTDSVNPDCDGFDETDPKQQGLCDEGEACLFYSWQRSPTSTSFIRECFSTSILLGSIDNPLETKSTCSPKDISEGSGSRISACLCDSDLCNSYKAPGEKTKTNALSNLREQPKATPRRQDGANRQDTRNRPKQTFHPDKPGLQCYSCGSLLNPNKKCDKFNREDRTQVQTCLTDESCLMYTWKKSPTQTATLRECFPTRVLLGSISDPLVPLPDCSQRDITDDGSGSIFACLCDTDFCNDGKQIPLGSGGGRRTTRRPTPTTRRTVPPRRIPPTTTRAPSRNQATTRRSAFPQRQQLQASCPPEFELLSGGCYYVSDDRVGWIEARKNCELREARLLSLESETERLSVVSLISSQTRRRRSEYWLAGNDIEEEGVWEWAKVNTPVASFGWTDGPYESYEENCLAWTVTIEKRTGGSDGWHASSCCNNLRYICQL